ncbi:MAG: FtsX-like permease family protein [Thermoplasmatota archaeon]
MNTLYRKSLRDLSRRKTRTFFTILTIALGVMGISFFAISPLAERTVDDEVKAENLYDLRVRMDPLNLSDEQIGDLRGLYNVRHVEARTLFHTRMFIGERRNSAIFIGIRDVEHQDLDRIVLISGDYPDSGEVITERSNSINGIYHGGEGDILTALDHSGGPVRFEISGTGRSLAHAESAYDSEGGAIFYTGMENVRRLSGISGYNYLSFDLIDTDEESVRKTVESVRSYLSNNTSFITFSNIPDVRGSGDWPGGDLLDTIVTVLYVLTLLAMICSVFLISNTMNTIITEQRSEIAQMKAVGSSRSQIFRSYTATSAVMGLIGSTAGALLGIIVSHMVVVYFGNLMGFQPDFMIHIPTALLSFLAGIALAVGASLPAIFKTMRIPTREGLEQKGLTSDFGRRIPDRILMRFQRKLPRLIQMGIRNSGRSKGRSASTVMQIAVAVGVFIGLTSFGYSMGIELSDTIDNLDYDLSLTVDHNSGFPLPVNTSEYLGDIDGIDYVEPSVLTNFNVEGQDIFAVGYPEDTRVKLHDKTISHGRWVSADEMEIVLGRQLSESIDAVVGDSIDVETASGNHRFTVVGIDTDFYYMGYVAYVEINTLQRVLRYGNNVTGFYAFCSAEETEVIDAVSVDAEDAFSRNGYSVTVDVKHAVKEMAVAKNRGMINTITATSAIIVLISMVGLSSTIAMNVLDRTREIGIMRCLGATSGRIRTILSSEGVFLSMIGWIIGVPMGYAVARGISGMLSSMIDWEITIHFPPEFLALSFAAAVIGSLVIAQGPIFRATRLVPEDALRYQ